MKMSNELFDEIFQKYYQPIYAYCFSKIFDHDGAVSITHDTLLLLYHKYDELDFSNCPEACTKWLYEVAKRKIWRYTRDKAQGLPIENLEDWADTLADPEAFPNDQAYQNELYVKSLHTIKDRLNKRDAALFDLLMIQKLKQVDAAKRLGIKPENVKMRWHRLKPKIYDIIVQMKKDGEL